MMMTPNNNNRRPLALHRDVLLAHWAISIIIGRRRRSLARATALCFSPFCCEKMAQEKRGKQEEEQRTKEAGDRDIQQTANSKQQQIM